MALFSVLPTRAQQQDPGAQFLELTPARSDLTLNAGTTAPQTVDVTNRHTEPITLRVSFDNILPEGEDGSEKIVSEPTPYDLKQWTTVHTSELTLAPRERKSVFFTINIPASAAPGGYYGILRLSPAEPVQAGQVAVRGDIASLYLVRVAGAAREQGEITEAYAARRDGGKISGFYFGDYLNFVTKVRNTGNVHFASPVNVLDRNAFRGTDFQAQIEPRNIFPDSVRKFEVAQPKAHTGWHTVTVKSQLPGGEAQRQYKFFVLTPFTAMVAAIVLAVLALLWFYRRRLIRRYSGRRRGRI